MMSRNSVAPKVNTGTHVKRSIILQKDMDRGKIKVGIDVSLSFEYVILIFAIVSVACDAQNKRSGNIAIEDENHFWQPPSEAWVVIRA